MNQTIYQRRILKDHFKRSAKVPVWDMETLCDMAKGAAAVVLAGVAVGLVAIAIRLMWEISNGYLDYFLRGLA